MDPYNAKVWKRELSELTSDWVAGRVPDAPIDDVIRSSIGIRTEGYTHQAIFYYPKRGGFQAITDGIASTIRPRVRLKTRAEDIVRQRRRWRVNGEEVDLLVSTPPLPHPPDILPDMPTPVARAMRGLEHNPP